MKSCYLKQILLLLSMLFLLIFLKNAVFFLYDHSNSIKVYNTGNYFLTLETINENYDKETFLSFYHLKLLGIELSPENFKRYSFYLILLFSGLIVFLASQAISLRWGIVLCFIIILSPIFLIQLNWIGFPEYFMYPILGIMIALLYYQDSMGDLLFYFILVPIILIGFWSHYYQFFVAGSLIIITDLYFKKKLSIPILILWIFLFFLSSILADYYFQIYNVFSTEDRLNFAIQKGFIEWYEIHRKAFPLSIYSLFNGLSLLILYLTLVSRDKIFYFLVIVSLAITFHTLDTTRVFSNIFYPAFLYYLIRKIETEDYSKLHIYTIFILLGILLSLLVDPFFVWDSRVIYLK